MPEDNIDMLFRAALTREIEKGGRGTRARLAKALGVSPTHIGDLMKRRYGSEQLRRRVASFFGYNYESFLDLGRGMVPGPRVPLDRICPTVILASEFREKPEISLENYFAAPLIPGSIAAGPGRVLSEFEIESYVWIYGPELKDRLHHNLIAVTVDPVSGDSMRPTLEPGDIVLVDRDDPAGDLLSFVDRKIYAIRDGEGGAAVKRLYRSTKGLVIYSDNREVPPEIAWTGSLVELIIGRVVWGWRNLLGA